MPSSYAPATYRRRAANAAVTNAKRTNDAEKIGEAQRDLVAIQIQEYAESRMVTTPVPLTRAQVTAITNVIKRA